MTESINPDDRRTEIALARYTLILPIVRETSQRQRHQMRKNIAAAIHDFPPGVKGGVSVTTLYRWEKAYRQGGFDALKHGNDLAPVGPTEGLEVRDMDGNARLPANGQRLLQRFYHAGSLASDVDGKEGGASGVRGCT